MIPASAGAIAPGTPGAAARVAFLDDDHVLRLLRGLLTARTEADRREVAAFFAPEPVDHGELDRLRAGLDVHAARDPAQATVLVLRRGRVGRDLVAAAPRLRLIQRIGRRRDGIDLAAAREHGVEVSCLPRPSLVRTAEHAIALMLALTKRLLPADQAVRTGTAAGRPGDVAYNWAGLTGLGGLAGRTLGVVGLGEVGTLVAERAHAFGMRVVAATRTPPGGAPAGPAVPVEIRPLGELLAEADIVSLHVPGGAVREPVIGRAEIAAMRPGALLVNTGRGHLVDEDALYAALAAGRLGGAGLDVHGPNRAPATTGSAHSATSCSPRTSPAVPGWRSCRRRPR